MTDKQMQEMYQERKAALVLPIVTALLASGTYDRCCLDEIVLRRAYSIVELMTNEEGIVQHRPCPKGDGG